MKAQRRGREVINLIFAQVDVITQRRLRPFLARLLRGCATDAGCTAAAAAESVEPAAAAVGKAYSEAECSEGARGCSA